ncbi:class-II fumarase/aspartase family protein [Allokutzneria albata]|uniref:3-carboxy-cis,cis-muconate cycloisomerase n=1 Tax=Allokutzneria albata TaxID=211114 RepID=A0A1H0DCJ2_ALLAB|nr:adenylosuccinate lyase family protein [Allokutzneria albata]SDN67892.1 3-carboxy-cis,cis-muconate cycloisomerase [Allokutzneria albata]
MSEPGLFDGVLAAGSVREVLSDTAWIQAMLDFEAALAAALADVGLVDRAHANSIAEHCRAEFYDAAELAKASVHAGNPAAPLVRALSDRVGDGHVHLGATSQDVVDTAAMIVIRNATAVVLQDVHAAAQIAAGLAREHVDTVQPGRTLLRQATPVTFGFTAAGWLIGLVEAAERLEAIRPALQFGGASGTLAALGQGGVEVAAALARRLDLAEPVLPWHTVRLRIAEPAAALGALCGVLGTIARDITLLAQTEIGEVTEEGPPGSGSSSTMPHKNNPVAAVAALGCSMQAPGLVATLLHAGVQEHQRAAGAWHAEWSPLRELLRTSGSAAYWLRTSLERLRVHPLRMRANLAGDALVERIATELTPVVGRRRAYDAVTRCCVSGDDLVEALAGDPVVGTHLSRERLHELLRTDYLGSAKEFVERALRRASA